MNLPGLKILYIEDNLGDRIILEEYLLQSVKVDLLECCTTLLESAERIKKTEFDLILLDLSLPDSHGVESVRLLNERISSSIPIIVFTGLNDNDVAMKALKFGAQDFLVKGDFTFSLINKTIRYAVERHKVQHELVLKSKELSISKNLLNRAESMADIGSWEVDFKSRQVKLSEGMIRLLGLDPDIHSISLDAFLTFVHAEDSKLFGEILMGNRNIIEIEVIELRFLRQKSKIFHSICKIEFSSNPSADSRIHGVTLDISYQKEIEKVKEAFTLELASQVKERTKELENTKIQLENSLSKERELGELKSRFVSTASHQFRTPLTVIQSNIGLLEMQTGPEERKLIPLFDKITSRIKNEVIRMTNIMDEVLVLGKINSGAITPVFKEVDIVDISRKVIDKFNEIQGDGRQASITVIGTNRLIEIDENLFEDAFSNMLSNAFKYSAGEPSPEITIVLESSYLSISVKDFGMGIPEEDLKNLFAPFFRASNALDIPGNGLGTVIMKEYIELNNGKLNVKTSLGKGATFTAQFNV